MISSMIRWQCALYAAAMHCILLEQAPEVYRQPSFEPRAGVITVQQNHVIKVVTRACKIVSPQALLQQIL